MPANYPGRKLRNPPSGNGPSLDGSSSRFDGLSTQDLLAAAALTASQNNPQDDVQAIVSALRSRLASMPAVRLLQAFFCSVHIDVAMLDQAEIFTALRGKTGQPFGDNVDEWMTWFLDRDDPQLETVKLYLRMQYDIYRLKRNTLMFMKNHRESLN